jgi:phage shock protein PspC (stress-responsive transcriptional regulator)
MSEKRLYRSCSNRIIGGVCGGLGEYFDIDPVLIRLIFVLLTFAAAGVVIYLIAWIIIPEDPTCGSRKSEKVDEAKNGAEEIKDHARQFADEIKRSARRIRQHDDIDGRFIVGLVIIALGAIFLTQNVLRINIFASLWPIILIIIGLFFLLRSSKK